jgi:RNA polymerase sigma-70 factor (ECF subfamily)
MGQDSREPDDLQPLIDRMHSGDPEARDELLDRACHRLRGLTRKMLKGFERVRRWELTDDVLQNALVRLWGALRQTQPRSAREFFGLAALQVRRELIDLARQYYGPEGLGAHHASHLVGEDARDAPQAGDRPDDTHDPGRLALWTEFHRQVDALPSEEREAFDLLWYQELTYAQACRVLGVSEATLKRRWLSARRHIHQALRGELPGI